MILPSKKQEVLLEFIDGFIRENNYAPSYREVMRALDYKSVSTVANHIEGLIERGWLVKRDNAKRSLEVTYQKPAGQGQMPAAAEPSPAPSLPSHEEWLWQAFEAQLSAVETNPDALDNARVLAAAMPVLGFPEVQLRAEAAIEQATQPRQIS